jgi:hypothetical protein
VNFCLDSADNAEKRYSVASATMAELRQFEPVATFMQPGFPTQTQAGCV